jgi:methyl-accepting chemotaxis protein
MGEITLYFSLRKKFFLSFISIIILFVVTVTITTLMNQRIQQLNKKILTSEDRMEVVQRLNLFARTTNDDGAHFLLAPNHLRNNFMIRFEADIEFLDKELVNIIGMTTDPQGLKQIDEFKQIWQKNVSKKKEIFALVDEGRLVEAQQLYARSSFDKIAFSLLAFVKAEQNRIEQYENEILTTEYTVNIISWTLVGLAIILSILIAFILSRYMLNRILLIKNSALEVAEGNLQIQDIQVRGKDELFELAGAFNTMNQSLREIIGGAEQVSKQVATFSTELQSSAEQTSLSTEHIALVMQDISDGTERQVSHVQDNIHTIKLLSDKVHHIAHNGQVVLENVMTTTKTAEQGKEDLNNAIQQVRIIETSNSRLSSSIEDLHSQSVRIGEAIELISQISRTTGLLALNAAIEAAQAGEHGKGFSVIATEVRKLAEQAHVSADQIKELITGIQKEAISAVGEMKNGTEEVQKGINLIEVAGDSFEGILELIRQVETDVQGVSSSTTQIMVDTEKVVEGTNLISVISKENSSSTHSIAASTEQQLATMEEITASSALLAGLSEELKGLIGKFRL